jgi:hypothetical protein
MNTTKDIKITGISTETMSWKRYVYFNYKDKEYSLTLFWDEFNGYEIFWREPDKTPDWVVNWNEDEHEGMSFEWYLDELTYNIK